MSFAWLRQAIGRVGARLVIGYMGLLLFSVSVLYGLAYWHMKRALQTRDQDTIRTELFELVGAYEEGGPNGMREEVREIAAQPGHPPFFIRLLDADGNLLFEDSKRPWPTDTIALRNRPREPGEIRWHDLAHGEPENLEVASYRLPDGRLLYAGASTEPRQGLLKQFQQTFLIAVLPVCLIALLGGLWLAHRILYPLRRLTSVTRHIIATGEVRERVPLRKTDDELDEVAGLFNAMLDRIERLLAGMRETLDHVAHDLRTPMTRLRGRVELALHADDPDLWKETLADTLEYSDQVLTILNTIMDEAEAEAGTLLLRLEPCSLRHLINPVAELYSYIAEEHGVILEVHGLSDVIVSVDRGRMSQVVANLIDNALKYTPEGGRVDVEIRKEGDDTIIQVRDTGIGIDAADLPRIWDRLYRGDRSRSTRGLGLGLSLVRAIVEAHGGHVGVASTPGVGTLFTIRLAQTDRLHAGYHRTSSKEARSTKMEQT